MLHIYRMYKLTKMVFKENEQRIQVAAVSVMNGGSSDELKMATQGEMIRDFSNKRILFKKVGPATAMATFLAANGEYLQSFKQDGEECVRVLPNQGMKLLDGVPFLRVGLWKAWKDEHGWIIAIIPFAYGSALAIITAAIKRLHG